MDQQFSFKKFQNTNKRYEDRITVTGTNAFGFPTKFYRDNKIDECKYVVLYYDDVNKAVAFQFTNSEEEKYKFTMIKSDKYGASINATSFFKENNLDSKKFKGRYKWTRKEYPEEGVLYIIQLKENTEQTKSPPVMMQTEALS